MAGLDGDDVAWLTSPDAAPVLAAAADVWRRTGDPLHAVEQLRRDGVAAGHAALAMTQARLRERARSRLGGLADRLLLTEDGLAQATRPVVAERRAGRLAASGATHVADLGCGLGLDTIAMAAAGLRVTAVDRDPAVVALAGANLAAVRGAGAAEVVVGDVTAPETVDRLLAAGVDAVFVDPARRDPSGPRRVDGTARRVTAPDRWSPPWSWVAALPARVPAVTAKLAPGVARGIAPGWETVWTSVDGHLVEAGAWSPRLARPGVRRAAIVVTMAHGDPRIAPVELTDADDPFGEDDHGGTAPVRTPGAYVCEPDDAVIRAGLVGAVVARCGGWLLDPRIAYVSCDSPPPASCDGLARGYRVLARTTTDPARLRAALRACGAGDVVVKRRGLDVEPARMRRAMRLRGDGPTLTVVLSRTPGGGVGLVVEPLE